MALPLDGSRRTGGRLICLTGKEKIWIIMRPAIGFYGIWSASAAMNGMPPAVVGGTIIMAASLRIWWYSK